MEPISQLPWLPHTVEISLPRYTRDYTVPSKGYIRECAKKIAFFVSLSRLGLFKFTKAHILDLARSKFVFKVKHLNLATKFYIFSENHKKCFMAV